MSAILYEFGHLSFAYTSLDLLVVFTENIIAGQSKQKKQLLFGNRVSQATAVFIGYARHACVKISITTYCVGGKGGDLCLSLLTCVNH